MPTKIVFKTKHEHDGTVRLKVRIVTKGFMQIPGVDYTETFAPVATQTAVRLVVVISLYYMGYEQELLKSDDEWVIEMFDVEAAFLNSEPQSTMYIEVPPVMVELGFVSEEEQRNSCYELMKMQYGNCDAALAFYRKFVKIVDEKIRLNQSKADPAVFYKVDNGRPVLLLAMHIDDTQICGLKKYVQWFMDEFEKHLKINRLGRLRKHLGVWYEFDKDKDGNMAVTLTMPKMIDEIAQDDRRDRSSVPGRAWSTSEVGTIAWVPRKDAQQE